MGQPDPERARIFLHALNGPFPVAEDVVEAWASETAEISPWLKGLGADVAMSGDYHTEPEYLELEGSDCYAGMDTVGGRMGNGLLHDFLRRALAERGIETRFRTPAVELIVDAGAVVGVVVAGPAGHRRIGARGGVVLATGGFAADPQMVRDYLRVEDHVLWGSPASTGDGHRLAQAGGRRPVAHGQHDDHHRGARRRRVRALPGVVERAQLPVGVGDGRRFTTRAPSPSTATPPAVARTSCFRCAPST